MLSLCLILPETWDYSVRGLVAICKEGKDSIVKILQELEQYGYLERHQLRRDDGKISYLAACRIKAFAVDFASEKILVCSLDLVSFLIFGGTERVQ